MATTTTAAQRARRAAQRKVAQQIRAGTYQPSEIGARSRNAAIYQRSGWSRLVPPSLKKNGTFRRHWLAAYGPTGGDQGDVQYIWDALLREAKDTNTDQAWESFREVYDALVYGF